MVIKTVLVSGGTRGIGKIISKELVDSGFKVIVLSKSDDSILKIKKDLKVEAYTCDVSDFKSVEKIMDNIDFDAVINCAGILGPVDDFESNDIDAWENTLEVNLLGTVYVNKIAISKFKSDKRGYGKIINFSGGGAAFSRIKHSAYAVSKTGVVRFTEIISDELKNNGFNIDVNALAPGAHKTDMWNDETFDKEPKNWDDKNKLVSMVKFLLSKDSDGLSGKFIHINDDLENINFNDKDLFTLRRIDNRTFQRVVK